MERNGGATFTEIYNIEPKAILNIVFMKNFSKVGKESVTAEMAHGMLQEEGLDISLEETKLLLDFLRKLAILTVKQYLKNHEDSRSIYQGEHGRAGRQRLLSTRSGRKTKKVLHQ